MKKSIKEAPKTDKEKDKNTRPFTTEDKGYTEEVYNKEQQKNYNKSEMANNNEQNTAGAES